MEGKPTSTDQPLSTVSGPVCGPQSRERPPARVTLHSPAQVPRGNHATLGGCREEEGEKDDGLSSGLGRPRIWRLRGLLRGVGRLGPTRRSAGPPSSSSICRAQKSSQLLTNRPGPPASPPLCRLAPKSSRSKFSTPQAPALRCSDAKQKRPCLHFPRWSRTPANLFSEGLHLLLSPSCHPRQTPSQRDSGRCQSCTAETSVPSEEGRRGTEAKTQRSVPPTGGTGDRPELLGQEGGGDQAEEAGDGLERCCR